MSSSIFEEYVVFFVILMFGLHALINSSKEHGAHCCVKLLSSVLVSCLC